MLDVNPAVTEITRAMSVAIAPVFLITGAGTLLGAVTVRYGRVIDRTRVVLREYKLATVTSALKASTDRELLALYRRAKLLRTTLIFTSWSIFNIVLSILVIFANIMLEFALPYVVPVLFGIALILLSVSLMLLIQDVAISLGSLKIEIREVLKRDIFKEEAPARSEGSL